LSDEVRAHLQRWSGLVPNVASLSDAEVLQRLEDTVWASDRKFFEQHPRRKFRLRPAFAVEVEDFDRHKPLRALPDGFCWWIAVRCLFPGARQRTPFGSHHLPAESSESDARRIWHRVTHPRWKQLAEMVEKRGQS
jgi:hypothetical protein